MACIHPAQRASETVFYRWTRVEYTRHRPDTAPRQLHSPHANQSFVLSDRLLAKTIVAVLIARRLAGGGSAQPSAEALAGLAAMIGHNWSIYIGFKGGQGVAILYATLLIICWPAVLIASLSTFAMLKLGRIVSLASLMGTVVTVIVLAVYVTLGRAPLPYLIFDILAVGLIGLRHKDDIQRFIAWTKSNAPWAFGSGKRD